VKEYKKNLEFFFSTRQVFQREKEKLLRRVEEIAEK